MTSPTLKRQINQSMRPGKVAAGVNLSSAPFGVKVGQLIAPPGGSVPRLVPGGVLDLHRAGFTTSPYRYMMACSSDHSIAVSGPRFYYSNRLDSGWVSRDDAAATFAAAGFTLNDTTNPVSIASWPGGSDYGEFFWLRDQGDGTITLYGHSQTLGTNQTQFWATSNDGVNFTYQGFIDAPIGDQHSASYSCISDDGGLMTLHGVKTSVFPISYAHWSSRDGDNWRYDPRTMHSRDALHFGYKTREVGKNWQVIRWRGEWWGITFFRDIPGQGGNTTNSDLIAVRISDDWRRCVGPAFFLVQRGGSGAFDEGDCGGGYPLIYHDDRQPNRFHVFYMARVLDGSSGAVGYAYFDADDYRKPTQAWTAQSGYELAGNIDRQGLPTPAGPGPLRTLYDLSAGLVTSKPAELTETVFTSAVFNYRAADDPAGACIEIVGGGSHQNGGLLSLTQAVDTSKYSEVWVRAEGIYTDVEDCIFQIGFYNVGNYDRGALWSDRIQSTTRRLIVHDGNGDDTRYEVPFYTVIDELRYADKVNLSLGLIRRQSPEGSSEAVFLEMWEGDQIVACQNITADFAHAAVNPFVRIISQNGIAATLRLSRFSVDVGDLF